MPKKSGKFMDRQMRALGITKYCKSFIQFKGGM